MNFENLNKFIIVFTIFYKKNIFLQNINLLQDLKVKSIKGINV